MAKRILTMILSAVLICSVFTGCEMLNDLLTYEGNIPKITEEEEDTTGENAENGSSADETSQQDELIEDSEWNGAFAYYDRNYIISDVRELSFRFLFTNLGTGDQEQGTAEFKNYFAVYNDFLFQLTGDVLSVTLIVERANSDELQEFLGEFWRAFDYLEIDPAELEEDEGMISQKAAMSALEVAIGDAIQKDMFLYPAGAIIIEGQPCWTFTLGNNFESKEAGIANYAVSREGHVFLRDDYLIQYIILPYVSIETVVN